MTDKNNPQNPNQNAAHNAPKPAPQSGDKNAPQKQESAPKLTTSEKYIKVGKLYEKLEKLEAEKVAIMEEIKQIKGR
ncbi:hypothetical protein, partial [Helicobacter heilmannii]|uniref:hypothetical protein n=1 Tax=Helicobacter heilmannii TaxID=35817 RepID=UPI0006B35BBC